MDLKLNIGGQDNTFTTGFISGRKLRETIAISD